MVYSAWFKGWLLSYPLNKEAQPLFTFEWTPLEHQACQLAWTVLLQGFKDSPHLFGHALSRELQDLTLPQGTVQYVDDTLICCPMKETSDYNSIVVLNFLGGRGYQVSSKKAPSFKQKIRYLENELTPGHHSLSIERKRAITESGPPTTKKPNSETFLGITGFCWILGLRILSKPLYETTGRPDEEPLKWDKKQQGAFQQIKTKLSSAQLWLCQI